MHSQSEQRHPKRGAKRLVLFRAVGLCPPPSSPTKGRALWLSLRWEQSLQKTQGSL